METKNEDYDERVKKFSEELKALCLKYQINLQPTVQPNISLVDTKTKSNIELK